MLFTGGVLLLLMPAYAEIMQRFDDFEGLALSWIAIPFLSVWAAVIYFETLNPFAALLRAFKLIRWGSAIGMGLLLGFFNLLFFLFLDSPLWSMSLQLLSWFVPEARDAMSNFQAVATTFVSGVLMYFYVLISLLCGGLQYFSFREVADAASMRDELERFGHNPKIRGLARE